MNFEKIFEAAKDFLPDAINMIKPKKKDPSEMCEFTIKGNEDFVIKAMGLILG